MVLRGNHDSSYWEKHTTENKDGYTVPQEGWDIINYKNGYYLYEKKYPKIWYLPDEGCIYNIGDYNILFIPGAYSVDKWYRIDNEYPWNPDEQLDEFQRKELEQFTLNWLNNNFPIDFVIGHTFPRKLEKWYDYLFMQGIDQFQVDKSMENWLDYFSTIYENAPDFKHYFGGHFHGDIDMGDQYTMLFHRIVELANYEGDK